MMRTVLCFLFFFSGFSFFSAQEKDPFHRTCALNAPAEVEDFLLSGRNCGNTSAYYKPNQHANPLYIPQISDDIIYIKINFIFLTKPDGTGNFEENNLEHQEFIDNLIAAFNGRLAHIDPSVSGCEVFPQSVIDTRIRVIVNKIWKVDPAWDYLVTGFNPSANNPYDNNSVLIPGSTYYYSYLDYDASIPKGLNITFANNGTIYSQYQTGDFSKTPLDWAVSEFPFFNELSNKSRQFWPDVYNGFLRRKHFIVNNPNYGNPSWETVKAWYYGDIGYRGMVHELGHSLDLYHHDCGANIMSYSAGNHNYLSIEDISRMYQSASVSSVRQYFTENSFKSNSIYVNMDELWDINFRNYSNVRVDNNSSLRTTCRIIMAPESKVIVRNGSNFIIEGADVSSANNTSWNGIKVEGNGYCLILPDTAIDNGYFYAYTDNTILPNGKSTDDNFSNIKMSAETLEGLHSQNLFSIYPNPTGEFIYIKSSEKIRVLSVYDRMGQKIISIRDEANKIDVKNVPSGVYILEVKTDLGIICKKFIKK